MNRLRPKLSLYRPWIRCEIGAIKLVSWSFAMFEVELLLKVNYGLTLLFLRYALILSFQFFYTCIRNRSAYMVSADLFRMQVLYNKFNKIKKKILSLSSRRVSVGVGNFKHQVSRSLRISSCLYFHFIILRIHSRWFTGILITLLGKK